MKLPHSIQQCAMCEGITYRSTFALCNIHYKLYLLWIGLHDYFNNIHEDRETNWPKYTITPDPDFLFINTPTYKQLNF